MRRKQPFHLYSFWNFCCTSRLLYNSCAEEWSGVISLVCHLDMSSVSANMTKVTKKYKFNSSGLLFCCWFVKLSVVILNSIGKSVLVTGKEWVIKSISQNN